MKLSKSTFEALIKRTIIGILLMYTAYQSSGQLDQRMSYGITANLTLSQFPAKKVDFNALPGYGFGGSFLYGLNNGMTSLKGQLQFNRYGYYSPNLAANVYSNSAELYIGFSEHIKQISGFSFFLMASPSTSVVFAHSTSGAGQGGTVSYDRLNTGGNSFDLGLNGGISMELTNTLNLELSYSYQFLKRNMGDYIFPRPNGFKLGLDYTLGKSTAAKPEQEVVSEMLLKLAGDTLFVLNRSCSEKMTDSLLNELFRKNYTFSAFRIISMKELEGFSQRHDVLFYAIVGEFYAGHGEPVSEGIFLLDSTFNLTRYPYPVHTNYPRAAEPCFESAENTAITISRFNARLRERI